MTEPVTKPESSQAAIALSLSVYFIWGALTLYWKELHGFDSFELIGWRITSSVIVLVVVNDVDQAISAINFKLCAIPNCSFEFRSPACYLPSTGLPMFGQLLMTMSSKLHLVTS